MADESKEFDNYKELADYSLDADRERELLAKQKECTFTWTNKQGEPVGVIMTYLAARGKIWLAVTEKRARVAAVRRDPRTCIVISSAGMDWGTGKTVTYKGTTRVHQHDSPVVA
jgi:general stress protein 26